MTIKTRFKDLANGYQTAFFDIHSKGKRKFDTVDFKWKRYPKTEEERKDKESKLKVVKLLASRKEMEWLKYEHELLPEYDIDMNFFEYMDSFIANHKVKEIKKFYAVRKKFATFIGKDNIPCKAINESLLRKFVKFLESQLKGESPSNYFAKLKQVIKSAKHDHHFRENPAENIQVKKNQYLHKEVLNFDEIRILSNTPLNNNEVKKAFLFSCLTGLRFCDVKVLEWKSIHSDKIKIVQEKTKIPLSIPISQDAIDLLPKEKNKGELVFDLPSHTACQKWLKRWMVTAGIDKHISWHCGRHSYGTNLISYGVDVSIASKLLGHTSLANTQRYVSVNDAMKAKAISKFPSIKK